MKNKTLLIVDDSPTNIDVLKELLSDYRLLVAIDGKIALNIVKESEVDLILLDVMMPGLNGFEVAQILKSDETTKNIPIIFITARTDIESFIQGFELGAEDYIMKPFEPEVIIQAVNRKLEMNTGI